MLDSYLCFSERCMLLMFLTNAGWVDGYCWSCVLNLKPICPTVSVPNGAKDFTLSPWPIIIVLTFMHCIQCMHSQERHVIQCEHRYTCHLHQLPDSLLCYSTWYFHLYFGRNMMFLGILNVKLWVAFFSLVWRLFVCKTFWQSCIHRCTEACENILNT